MRLALRNIGRQRSRTITTMVALLIGVFVIGVILVLGQNVQEQVNQALVTENKPTAFILAPYQQKAALDQQLAGVPTNGPTVIYTYARGRSRPSTACR